MQTSDIFAKIRGRLVAGVMFHADMSNYFDFLNLHGFEKMHEYHLFEETAELRSVERYYTEHFNALIPSTQTEKVDVIPEFWLNHTRSDMSADAKRRAVRDGMAKWIDWETKSKALYGQHYEELCNDGEIAAAMKVGELICGVDDELKHAHNLMLTLEGVSYYMGDIIAMQDKLHEKFKGKMRKIWD